MVCVLLKILIFISCKKLIESLEENQIFKPQYP